MHADREGAHQQARLQLEYGVAGAGEQLAQGPHPLLAVHLVPEHPHGGAKRGAGIVDERLAALLQEGAQTIGRHVELLTVERAELLHRLGMLLSAEVAQPAVRGHEVVVPQREVALPQRVPQPLGGQLSPLGHGQELVHPLLGAALAQVVDAHPFLGPPDCAEVPRRP